MQSCCPQCECVSVWARWLMAPGQIANAIQDVRWESWRWSALRDKVCLPSEPASVVFRLCCDSLKSSAYVFKKACVEWKSQSLFFVNSCNRKRRGIVTASYFCIYRRHAVTFSQSVRPWLRLTVGTTGNFYYAKACRQRTQTHTCAQLSNATGSPPTYWVIILFFILNQWQEMDTEVN